MSNKIIDTINNLTYYTGSLIKDIANDLNPHISKKIIIERQQQYSLDNVIYYPAVDKSMVFLVKNLPYTYTNINDNEKTFSMTFKDAVEQGYVYPVLFFLDNTFIRWSEITLIKDYNYSFIIIEKYKEYCNMSSIYIPYTNVEYKEDAKLIKSKMFMFDINGMYTSLYGSANTYLEILDENINSEKMMISTNEISSFESDFIIENDNIICFNNGLLYPCEKTRYGLNVFSVDDENTFNLSIVAFYNKTNNVHLDNYTKVHNQQELKEMIINQDNESFCNYIKDNFDYVYTEDEVGKNINGFLEYIYNYNPILLNDIYRKTSTIYRKKYTGAEILKKKQYDGYVYFSRNVDSIKDSYIVVLVNGCLYSEYKNVRYNKNMFKLDPIYIANDDIVEIIYFNNIDNRSFDFYMWSGDESDILPLSADMDVDNIQIFSAIPFKPEFEYINITEDILYQVPFRCKRVDNNNINLILENPIYYDKKLFLSSKLQFQTHHYIAEEDSNIIELPSNFKMCYNEKAYLVYVNGQLVPSSLYELLTFSPSRPMNMMSLDMKLTINKDDIVDVIYNGINMNRIDLELDYDNTINIPKEKILFPYSKDLYDLYVNGIKIDNDRIVEMDSCTLSLLDFYDHVNSVELVCMVDNVDILTLLFKNNDDLLTKANDTLSLSERKLLYGDEINGIENDDITNSVVSDKDLARAVLNKHWNKPFINTGDFMNIDYDKTELFEDGIISNDD